MFVNIYPKKKDTFNTRDLKSTGRKFIRIFLLAIRTINLLKNKQVPESRGVLYHYNYLYCIHCSVQKGTQK